MYAIVDIAGKQFKVAKDQYIYAPKMDGEAGAAVSFDKVLLVEDGGTIQIGAPTVSGIKVSGKILEHANLNRGKRSKVPLHHHHGKSLVRAD